MMKCIQRHDQSTDRCNVKPFAVMLLFACDFCTFLVHEFFFLIGQLSRPPIGKLISRKIGRVKIEGRSLRLDRMQSFISPNYNAC